MRIWLDTADATYLIVRADGWDSHRMSIIYQRCSVCPDDVALSAGVFIIANQNELTLSDSDSDSAGSIERGVRTDGLALLTEYTLAR